MAVAVVAAKMPQQQVELVAQVAAVLLQQMARVIQAQQAQLIPVVVLVHRVI
jgi:hypothetical protein